MHTENERKYLLWTAFCNSVVELESNAFDESRPYLVPITPQTDALYNVPFVIHDFLKERFGAKWIDTNKRSCEEIADTIKYVSQCWMDGTLPPIASKWQDGMILDKNGLRAPTEYDMERK